MERGRHGAAWRQTRLGNDSDFFEALAQEEMISSLSGINEEYVEQHEDSTDVFGNMVVAEDGNLGSGKGRRLSGQPENTEELKRRERNKKQIS